MEYIHLYIEKFDKYENFLLLDFISDEEFCTFTEQLDYPTPDQQSTASMLRFEQMPFNENYYPKEGSVYRIPISVFNIFRMNYNNNYGNDDNSPIIRFTYTYNPEDTKSDGNKSSINTTFSRRSIG